MATLARGQSKGAQVSKAHVKLLIIEGIPIHLTQFVVQTEQNRLVYVKAISANGELGPTTEGPLNVNVAGLSDLALNLIGNLFKVHFP